MRIVVCTGCPDLAVMRFVYLPAALTALVFSCKVRQTDCISEPAVVIPAKTPSG